jgi:hypothetical protein
MKKEKDLMVRRTVLMVTLLLLVTIAPVGAQAPCFSQLVYPGDDGTLIYVPDAQGNRIPDFSNVGYMGGSVDPPNVPVRATVEPASGDAGARIQAAIDRVSSLPLDENGFRGTVLLKQGEYRIGDHIEIRASGVVLRGEGKWEQSGATVLRATGTSRRALVQVKGSGSRQRVGAVRNILDKYVPVGATTFQVDSTDGLIIGDTIIVHRPSPANWIHDIGMDRLTNPWQPNSKNIDWDRVIVDMTDNQITIDAPVTTALDQRYGGGTIYKYTWPGRIENVGIENMKGKSDYRSATDENHSWDFISLDSVQNAWVRDVASQYFAYSLSNVHKSAKWVTVANSDCLDPKSQITGGRRYSFNVDGQLTLVKDCRAREGRHDFVMGSVVPGPNVFVRGLGEHAHADSGPHHRWSSGALFDNITVQGNELNARNRGNSGTGHGWAGANMLAWNSRATRFRFERPPTAQNWAIGNAGARTGNGFFDSHGCAVEPQSLYDAQLAERTAYGGLQTREYWLGDIDNFTNDGSSDCPYTDKGWWNTVATTNKPLIGFDDLTPGSMVPFTFKFNRRPGETVVSATLTLALRASGSDADAGLLYLGSLDNAYGYADLGWQSISDGQTSVRVVDLSSQLELLQDGQLNVALAEDSAVDWAMLRLKVIPVP